MTGEQKDKQKLLERLSMFNDAVYAIALTLLVLELKLPEGVGSRNPAIMWHQLYEMTPRFFAFLLSVLVVGGNWISSVNIQRVMAGADTGMVIYFVFYLIIISLTPFCCNLIGTNPDNPVSFVIFGIVGMLIIINGALFLRHIRIKNLYHADADVVEIGKLENIIPWMSIFIVAVAAVAYYSTKLSFALFLVYNTVPIFSSKSLKVNHKE